ncbi:MAG: hypothetical protein H6727_02715 [Myxococcales bacterium]|nr:hypothetical protein [Myxococcales bacterium]
MDLRISKTEEAYKQSSQQLIKLNQALEESQNALNQARQQLLTPTAEALPSPTSPPTSRPASSTSKPAHPEVPGLLLAPPKSRDPLAERQRQAFLQSLNSQHRRVQFDVARLRVRLTQIRQEDERYNQEYHRHRLQLFLPCCAKMPVNTCSPSLRKQKAAFGFAKNSAKKQYAHGYRQA